MSTAAVNRMRSLSCSGERTSKHFGGFSAVGALAIVSRGAQCSFRPPLRDLVATVIGVFYHKVALIGLGMEQGRNLKPHR